MAEIQARPDREHALGEPPGRGGHPRRDRPGAQVGERRRTAMSARVRIVYCAECGYEPQTLALADALMRRFGHELASIELVPWLDGTFEVSVDGRLVHSMARDGGFPAHATVIEAVAASLGAGQPPRRRSAQRPSRSPSSTAGHRLRRDAGDPVGDVGQVVRAVPVARGEIRSGRARHVEPEVAG